MSIFKGQKYTILAAQVLTNCGTYFNKKYILYIYVYTQYIRRNVYTDELYIYIYRS